MSRNEKQLNFNLDLMCVCVLKCIGHVRLCVTLQTAACQAPLSMGSSRQEYWSGLPFPLPGSLPNPGNWNHISGLLPWQAVLYQTWVARITYVLLLKYLNILHDFECVHIAIETSCFVMSWRFLPPPRSDGSKYFRSVMRGHKKALFTSSYWCIQMCLTAQILVVIKRNSHKGEQANTSQSPVQATFQLKVRSIPEGTAQYSPPPQPPTPENHLQPAFYCGKFLSDLFSLFFFFFSAAFFSCKSMLRLSSKATALLEFPAHSSREVFSCRISKTLQSQQNLPQRRCQR